MKDGFSLEAKIYDKILGKLAGYDAEVKFLYELFNKHGCKRIGWNTYDVKVTFALHI